MSAPTVHDPWDLDHQPPVNTSLEEACQRGYTAGYRDGYAAGKRAQLDAETVDTAIIERFSGLLALLRKKGA